MSARLSPNFGLPPFLEHVVWCTSKGKENLWHWLLWSSFLYLSIYTGWSYLFTDTPALPLLGTRSMKNGLANYLWLYSFINFGKKEIVLFVCRTGTLLFTNAPISLHQTISCNSLKTSGLKSNSTQVKYEPSLTKWGWKEITQLYWPYKVKQSRVPWNEVCKWMIQFFSYCEAGRWTPSAQLVLSLPWHPDTCQWLHGKHEAQKSFSISPVLDQTCCYKLMFLPREGSQGPFWKPVYIPYKAFHFQCAGLHMFFMP